MVKIKFKENELKRDDAINYISKNLSQTDREYCNEIICFSDQVFSILGNGGVRIALQNDKTDISGCTISLEVNERQCPLFETSTLKELRNKLKSFLEYAEQFKLKGLNGIHEFLNDLQNHSVGDSSAECRKRMMCVDMMVFIGTFILPKHRTEFISDKSPAPTIH